MATMSTTLMVKAIILMMAAFSLTGAIACTSNPQDKVEDIEGTQNVHKLFQKYRKIGSESPDQLKILKDNKQPETFHGKITKPIKDRKVQMHLRTEPLIVQDTYAECILHDPNQVFFAKVGDHVTISGRLSDFSRHKISFTECDFRDNHTN